MANFCWYAVSSSDLFLLSFFFGAGKPMSKSTTNTRSIFLISNKRISALKKNYQARLTPHCIINVLLGFTGALPLVFFKRSSHFVLRFQAMQLVLYTFFGESVKDKVIILININICVTLQPLRILLLTNMIYVH